MTHVTVVGQDQSDLIASFLPRVPPDTAVKMLARKLQPFEGFPGVGGFDSKKAHTCG